MARGMVKTANYYPFDMSTGLTFENVYGSHASCFARVHTSYS